MHRIYHDSTGKSNRLGLQLLFLPHISKVECPPRSRCGFPKLVVLCSWFPLIVALTSLDSIYLSLSQYFSPICGLCGEETGCHSLSSGQCLAEQSMKWSSRCMCRIREEWIGMRGSCGSSRETEAWIQRVPQSPA